MQVKVEKCSKFFILWQGNTDYIFFRFSFILYKMSAHILSIHPMWSIVVVVE